MCHGCRWTASGPSAIGRRVRQSMASEARFGLYSNEKEVAMRRLALGLVVMISSSSAVAAGIDSHRYTCNDLHALIMATGFVFINNADFEDFVVANATYCESGGLLRLRSVTTRDHPECPVNYCVPPSNTEGKQ
jgi:hypothetical protein